MRGEHWEIQNCTETVMETVLLYAAKKKQGNLQQTLIRANLGSPKVHLEPKKLVNFVWVFVKRQTKRQRSKLDKPWGVATRFSCELAYRRNTWTTAKHTTVLLILHAFRLRNYEMTKSTKSHGIPRWGSQRQQAAQPWPILFSSFSS